MQPETRRANLEVRLARLISPAYARDLMADIELAAGLDAIESLLAPTPQQVRDYKPPTFKQTDYERLSPLERLHLAHSRK